MIIDNVSTNSIDFKVNMALLGGSDTIIAGAGINVDFPLASKKTISIAPNGITNGMIGTGVVMGMNLDQSVRSSAFIRMRSAISMSVLTVL